MRKYLLGTTAVVAASAIGGAAYAQSAAEPIKLGLGGYWRGAAGALLNKSGPAFNQISGQDFAQDSTIYVKGDTKFDNGLSVGAAVQFRGEGANSVGGTDTVKRSYVRFFGGFGEVRFGDDEESRLQKAIDAPQAGSLFGVNSPFFSFASANDPIGSNTTQKRIGPTKRSHRIAYFSPTIAGFSFAASYAPQQGKGLLTSPGVFLSTTRVASATTPVGDQTYSIAAAYDNKFGDFRVSGSVAYSRGQDQGGGPGSAIIRENPSAVDAGLNVGFGPFTVGGSFEHFANARKGVSGGTAFSNGDNNTFDLGAQYTVGPFSTSIGWSRGYYKSLAKGNTTAIYDVYDLIADYVLGPGVSVGAVVDMHYYRSGTDELAGNGATQNLHSVTLAVGTAFTF